jgi:hypothetical protein
MMTIEEVKDEIYNHITQEHNMGLPPHESWESIDEDFEGYTDSEYSLEDIKGWIFDQVMEEWWKDHPEVSDEEEEDEDE